MLYSVVYLLIYFFPSPFFKADVEPIQSLFILFEPLVKPWSLCLWNETPFPVYLSLVLIAILLRQTIQHFWWHRLIEKWQHVAQFHFEVFSKIFILNHMDWDLWIKNICLTHSYPLVKATIKKWIRNSSQVFFCSVSQPNWPLICLLLLSMGIQHTGLSSHTQYIIRVHLGLPEIL